MLLLSPVLAATLHVPGDHATVQAAVSAAQPGDVVQIGPGTWSGFIWPTGELTVRGAGQGLTRLVGTGSDVVLADVGASLTLEDLTLDGQSTRRTLRLREGAVELTLRDVELVDGHSTDSLPGGCLFVEGITATLDGVGFEGCTSELEGGAIYAKDATLLGITDSWFVDNTAVAGGGGAIEAWTDVVLVVATTLFQGNRATAGGAIEAYGGGQVLVGTSSFIENEATWHGGAVNARHSASIRDCSFVGNAAGLDGGAVRLELGGSATKSFFWGNRGLRGGAVAAEGGPTVVTNAHFCQNVADDTGNAIWMGSGSRPTASNLLFVTNGDAASQRFDVDLTGPGTLRNATFTGSPATLTFGGTDV
ncbi:MAG: hypothetical protein KC656_20795, partial [Myxococcales bacterium]|nr:hypothetical protein [Myxococcales bacterium]